MDKLRDIFNTIKYLGWFILVGWIAFLYKKLLKKDQEILIKDYSLRAEEISHEIDNSSIDDLVRKSNNRK